MTITVDPMKISIPARRHRRVREEKVNELAASIREIGLLQPPVVDSNLELIAGKHRLLAVRQLGWAEVEVNMKQMTALDQELAEIDENLYRAGLTVMEEAAHLARREEILIQKGQRKRAGALKKWCRQRHHFRGRGRPCGEDLRSG